MEIEQPSLREVLEALRPSSGTGSGKVAAGKRSIVSLQAGTVAPASASVEEKLMWLRSQVIGGDARFESPFGKRHITYADHTASGRCLGCIEDYITDNVLPSYGNTHTTDSYVGHRTTKMVSQATKYIKKCLGGGPESAILFCGSGCTGAIKRLQEVMGISIPSILRDRMLRCLPDEEKWVVFVGPYEHHSNILSWRESLAEVIEIGQDGDGLVDMESLRHKLGSFRGKNRPLLGSFSACSNVTGTYSDTRAIAKLLHQFGAFACFDFAASGPYVEIDMRSGEIDGYDAIFLSPHKFLGGPGSPGVLLMSKALYQLKSSPPSTCGGGTVNYVNGFSQKDTLYLEDIEERENGGTPQIIQITRAALAFWVKEYVGYEAIKNLEHKYIREAIRRLLPNQNVEILGNTSADRQAILSFLIYSTTNSSSTDGNGGVGINGDGRKAGELYMWEETGNRRDKPLHGPFVASLLNDLFGIQARGGCACAGPYGHSLLRITKTKGQAIRSAIEKGFSGVRPGWTRISFPYYMSQEEFEFILAALEFVASYGQRFLPLYHFNLKTGSWTFKKKALTELVGKNENCNFRILEVAASLQTMNMNENRTSESHNIIDNVVNTSIIKEFAAYLECARYVAGRLPKFPPPRQLGEEIDTDLLYFRI